MSARILTDPLFERFVAQYRTPAQLPADDEGAMSDDKDGTASVHSRTDEPAVEDVRGSAPQLPANAGAEPEPEPEPEPDDAHVRSSKDAAMFRAATMDRLPNMEAVDPNFWDDGFSESALQALLLSTSMLASEKRKVFQLVEWSLKALVHHGRTDDFNGYFIELDDQTQYRLLREGTLMHAIARSTIARDVYRIVTDSPGYQLIQAQEQTISTIKDTFGKTVGEHIRSQTALKRVIRKRLVGLTSIERLPDLSRDLLQDLQHWQDWNYTLGL